MAKKATLVPATLADKVAREPKVLIDGVEYLTPKQVAQLLGFSTKTINLLIQQGNKYGKLPVRRRLGFSRWGFVNLIPKDALFTYTFAEVGPYGRPFRFDPEGHRQYVLDL